MCDENDIVDKIKRALPETSTGVYIQFWFLGPLNELFKVFAFIGVLRGGVGLMSKAT
jgi:hypothetical protein